MSAHKLNLILLALFLFSFIVFLVTTARRSQIIISSRDGIVKLHYDSQLILTGRLDTVYAPVSVTAEHDRDYLLLPENIFPQQFSIRLPEQTTAETGMLQKTVSNKTLWENIVFPVFYTGLMSDDSKDIKSKFKSKANYRNFELTLHVYNPSIIRIDFSGAYIWLRPLWHQEAFLYQNDGTSISGNRLKISAVTHLKQIVSRTSLNILSAILIYYFILILNLLFSGLFRPVKLPQIKVNHYFFILLAGLVFFLTTLAVAIFVFKKIPNSQDEVAYLFQAKILSLGKLFSQSPPPEIRSFFDQEFIINNGKWFGKYTVGGSLLLALGYLIGNPHIINPVISSITLALLYFLCKQIFSTSVAILSVVLFMLSPFNILISASYFSHPVASLFTVLLFFGLFKNKPYLVGLSLGLILITRPYNAIISGLTIAVYLFLFSLKISNSKKIITSLIPKITLTFLPFFIFQLYHNYVVSGSISTFPINVYSDFDKIGFGKRGIEWGDEFTPLISLENLAINFYSLSDMLFGWPFFLTFSFLPFALINKKKETYKKMLVFVVFFILTIAGYFFYHAEGAFYGPRYWYEAGFVPIILTALGISNLKDYFTRIFNRNSALTGILVVILPLLVYSTLRNINYLPPLSGYGEVKPPALPKLREKSIVLIQAENVWYQYGIYLINQSPELTDQVIYARYNGLSNLPSGKNVKNNNILRKYFPDRKIYFLNEGTLKEL